MKNIVIVIMALVILGGVSYMYMQNNGMLGKLGNEGPATNEMTATSTNAHATSTLAAATGMATSTVIGTSIEGRDIVAYHYGTGTHEILFVAGIHGGYAWGTSLVAYEAMDYLAKNSATVPANVRVTIIPVLNPDGLYTVVGTTGRFAASAVSSSQEKAVAGRFNAHTVDLNRNFDCDWKASGTWQSKTVSGGTSPFSEPESAALKRYVEAHAPTAVVAWYSAAGGVYASSCGAGVSSETRALMNTYANASGYAAHEDFDSYAVTGDMVNWFAKNGVPAISVLLTTHEDMEWSKNQKGIDAVLTQYAR